LDKIVAEGFDPTVMMVITSKGKSEEIELPALA
jgi:hypothetical protein